MMNDMKFFVSYFKRLALEFGDATSFMTVSHGTVLHFLARCVGPVFISLTPSLNGSFSVLLSIPR